MKHKFHPKYGHNLKKQQEIVLCAAIWYKELDTIGHRDLEGERDNLRVQRLPINCDRGMVFCGHRHLQAMRTMNSITGLSDHQAGESVQGFLTNYNRFVDRKEGGAIAFAAGQTDTLKLHMFSEDLY